MISADAVRGHIDLIVLAILEAEPSYAYEISRQISEISNHQYTIKQTTLYTAVKRLQSQGYLISEEQVAESGKPRTYYYITAEGTQQLALKRAEWKQTRELVNHFAENES